MHELKPMCFVLMPFGTKPDPSGGPAIPFDRIYVEAIRPAIEDAGLEPIRADEESSHGIIHKAMFERLLLCEFAVADLTTANANVFYELGVRHAGRPSATISVFASHQTIPFDLNFLRGIPYELGSNNAFGDAEAARLRQQLSERLKQLRAKSHIDLESDSPVFQLIEDWRPTEVSRLKTDVFRERARVQADRRQLLGSARASGDRDALDRIAHLLASEGWTDLGSSIDLMLSFRAISDWDAMVDLVAAFPGQLQRVTMVREQLAFALNRRSATSDGQADDRQRAIEILRDLINEFGPTSESCGLLGKIYKDLWQSERSRNAWKARGFLNKAIETYRAGFEADWRDAYPGVNAVTLMYLSDNPEHQAESQRLAPIVRFAVEQRLRGAAPDYWDYATLFELAVIMNNRAEANQALEQALGNLREAWEAHSTLGNLNLLIQARDDFRPWLMELAGALGDAAQSQNSN